MKILLIRHGETTGDLEDRYGGLYNDSLTENGKEQCLKLVSQISKYSLSAVYTSPLLRAQQTARYIADNHKTSLAIDYDLREKNHYSFLSGLTKREAKEEYPQLVNLLTRYDSKLPGAESYDELISRVKSSFDQIVINHKDTEIFALVTHGGWIRCFVREILKLGEIQSIGDCSYLILEIKNEEVSLIDASGIKL